MEARPDAACAARGVAEFQTWSVLLPARPLARGGSPVTCSSPRPSPDRTDPYLVHLDGLNLAPA